MRRALPMASEAEVADEASRKNLAALSASLLAPGSVAALENSTRLLDVGAGDAGDAGLEAATRTTLAKAKRLLRESKQETVGEAPAVAVAASRDGDDDDEKSTNNTKLTRAP